MAANPPPDAFERFGVATFTTDGPTQTSATQVDAELLARAQWPEGARFSVHDPEPDNHHSALYLVLPGGLCVNVSGHDAEGVDIARAHFMAAACNAALASPTAGAASDGEALDRQEADVRVAIWNACKKAGMADEAVYSVIQVAMADRSMKRALAAMPAPASSPSDGEAVERVARAIAPCLDWTTEASLEDENDARRQLAIMRNNARVRARAAIAAMPAPASSSDLGCQADRSPGDPANLAELMAAPASSSGVARPEIPWNNGNLQVRISGRWLVVDVANELARLIQGGARIEAIRALVTDEARHADRPHPLDSSGASK